jgi:PqqD family protein of HPr-rel-A system
MDRWKVAAPDALCWEHWDEESVLFDRRSSQTHLLTAMATECLLLLQDADLDLDQLSEKLGVRFHSAPEQATQKQIGQLLLTLSELGLIMTVPA